MKIKIISGETWIPVGTIVEVYKCKCNICNFDNNDGYYKITDKNIQELYSVTEIHQSHVIVVNPIKKNHLPDWM